MRKIYQSEDEGKGAMSENELKNIKFLRLEIKRTEQEIHAISSGNMLGAAYKKLLTETRKKLYEQKSEMETMINSVDDSEMRLILKLKFVDLRSWNYIANIMHYDRSTVYKKYKKFMTTGKLN